MAGDKTAAAGGAAAKKGGGGTPGEGAVGAKKPTVCPVSAAEFQEHAAQSLEVTIEGQVKAAVLKLFSTGSFGWFLNDKMDIKLGNGAVVKVQLGINLTVVGSKAAPRG